MAKWSDISVGDSVVYEGVECEVKALRPGKLSLRVVLEPVQDDSEAPTAKFAIKVKAGDSVELPEGAQKPDRAASLIKETLGAVEIAEIAENGEVTCPAVTLTTVASHLRIMHGVELRGLPIRDTDELMKIHEELHAAPFHEPAHPHTHDGPKDESEAA